jgi:hypothetical protein
MRLSMLLFRLMFVGVLSTIASLAGAQVVGSAVPIEVREVVATPAGVSATLVNRSTQPIAGYVVGLTYSSDPAPQHFEAMTSNWGAQWPAGREISLLLSPRPSDEPARVILPMAPATATARLWTAFGAIGSDDVRACPEPSHCSTPGTCLPPRKNSRR